MIISNTQYIIWWRKIQFLWHGCHVFIVKITEKNKIIKTKIEF